MRKLKYFDYQRVAQKIKVPSNVLKRIEKEVREDFPSDQMMYELHVLRAVKSRYWQKESYDKSQSPITADKDSC